VYLALREKYFPLKRLYLVATAAVETAGLIEGVVIMLGGSYIFTVLPLYVPSVAERNEEGPFKKEGSNRHTCT
jgi:hypothetical protein